MQPPTDPKPIVFFVIGGVTGVVPSSEVQIIHLSCDITSMEIKHCFINATLLNDCKSCFFTDVSTKRLIGYIVMTNENALNVLPCLLILIMFETMLEQQWNYISIKRG